MELMEIFKEHLETARRAVIDIERFQEKLAKFRADACQKSREEQLEKWGDLTAEATFLLTFVSYAKLRLNMLDIKQLPVSARGTQQAASKELNDQVSTLRAVVASMTERHRGLRDLLSAETEREKRMAPVESLSSPNG